MGNSNLSRGRENFAKNIAPDGLKISKVERKTPLRKLKKSKMIYERDAMRFPKKRRLAMKKWKSALHSNLRFSLQITPNIQNFNGIQINSKDLAFLIICIL